MSTRRQPRHPADLTVPITVELGAALAPVADGEEAAALAASLTADVDVLLQRLGLQGEAAVELQTGDSARPVRVSVHGVLQPYGADVVRSAWLTVAPPELHDLPAAATPGTDSPAAWFGDYVQSLVSAEGVADPSLAFAFVERLTYAVVVERPSCLLGEAQAAAYAHAAGLSPRDAAPVLTGLLALGVSVAGPAAVADAVREGKAIRRPVEDTVEAAFAELRSHAVELHVNPQTLLELLGRVPVRAPFSVHAEHVRPYLRRLFSELEEAFFSQFGFLLPDLVWVPSPAVPAGMLSLKIDSWTSLPTPIVTRGERVVDAPVEQLPIGGRTTLHPVTGARCTIVPDGAKARLEDEGSTTWGPIDFVVLNVFAAVTRHAGRLLGLEDVEYQLARLRYELVPLPSADGGTPFEYVFDGPSPHLVDEVLAQYSLGELTRILRAMVHERLSLQNLSGILERLLQYETVPLESDALVLLDDRLGVSEPAAADGWQSRYEFLRKQLKSYLSHKFAWHGNTVVAYLMAPEIEARVAAAGAAAAHNGNPLSDSEIEDVRSAVWRELTAFGAIPAGQVVLLTAAAARAPMRKLLEPELPDLPVLSHAELRPDVNVQPVARILVD